MLLSLLHLNQAQASQQTQPASFLLPSLGLAFMLLTSCQTNSDNNPSTHDGAERMIVTPVNGQVDLSKVTLRIDKVEILPSAANRFTLNFDYSMQNRAGATIAFGSVHGGIKDLLVVTLIDQEGNEIPLAKKNRDGLTYAEPRQVKIPEGQTPGKYTAQVISEFQTKGETITVRVRFHAPSRYDELRSTLEAPAVRVIWPRDSEILLP